MEVLQQAAESIRTESASVRAGTNGSVLARIVASAFAMMIAPYLGIRAMAAIVDPDIWWHIRTGDWIVQHRAVPHFAIFSQYSDRAWVAYSWIFEVAMSAVHHLAGLPALPAALICIQVLVSAVLLMTIERVGPNFWVSWCIAVATIYAIYGIPLRPMALTFVFFALELYFILEADRTVNDRLLLWIAPLFALWANTHIQFVYGLFILALYVATRLIAVGAPKWFGSSPVRAFPSLPMLALFLAVLAACIGPYGFAPYRVALDLAVHPVQNQGVIEMAAMDFRRPEHYVRVLLLIAAAFALGRSRRRELFRPLLLGATAVVSFHFTRDAWFVCTAAALVLAESLRVESKREDGRDSGGQNKIRYGLGAALALVASFAIASRHGLMDSRNLMANMDRVYPIRATEFIRDAGLKGPMYNSFNWGGFLIFNLPSQPVSVDPRVNIYGDALIQRSFNTANGVDWRTDPVLDRANFMLLEHWAPLAASLASDPRYRLAYEDQLSAVFVRDLR